MAERPDLSPETEAALARKGRIAALVIAGTALVWLAVQWIIGPMFGMTIRTLRLFDFAALAGFFWALVVTYQIWRSRRQS